MTRTESGPVRGTREAEVWVFRGIPYASAPGGAGRWRRPSPAPSWVRVRDALSWGPIAPQTPPIPGFSLAGDPTAWDEDCLNLNVWTAGVDDGRRPVLVWLHGGGFTTGTGASALFNGRRLAQKGAVVVTINYRLGALGLLADPELAGEDGGGCGNWSLHDQLAALGWVRANIAWFGGDPGNVTLVGESAGAMSVSNLLAAPAGAGLFHRAVIQSGPPATGGPPWALSRARRLAQLAGVGAHDRGALRHLPAEQLVAATQRLASEAATTGQLPLALLPVVDGGVLEEVPADVIAAGGGARVPLLVGSTRDECALFTVAAGTNAEIGEGRVAARLDRMVGPAAWEIVDAYREARAARGESVAGDDLWTAITTDYVFRMPLQALARAHAAHEPRTYSYLFTWESPFLEGRFGSCHGLEIPFVFGTVADPAVQVFTGGTPAALELSEAMQRAWVAFARAGDPSCDAVGDWPAYDVGRRATMVFGPGGGVEDDPRGCERAVWERTESALGIGHHYHQ
ncbi:MAG TPA: carboxylesterase/lipase family protein [Acidimicrobiales bacterium]|nr:carboxylesterase/lipase family protein [Acidimicrobiales bacterium]